MQVSTGLVSGTGIKAIPKLQLFQLRQRFVLHLGANVETFNNTLSIQRLKHRSPQAVAIGVTFCRKTCPDFHHVRDDLMLGRTDVSPVRQHAVEEEVHVVPMTDSSLAMATENRAYDIAVLGIVIKAVQIGGSAALS